MQQETDRIIGEHLKTLAAVFALIFAVASIAFAIVQLSISCEYSGYDFVKHGGITGLVLLLGGPLAAYLMYLLLYGFGIVIESCVLMREQTARISEIDETLRNLKLDITLNEECNSEEE